MYRTLVAAPYVFVIDAADMIIVKQSLMVPNAVAKFQAKCAKVGYTPNVQNGRIML